MLPGGQSTGTRRYKKQIKLTLCSAAQLILILMLMLILCYVIIISCTATQYITITIASASGSARAQWNVAVAAPRSARSPDVIEHANAITRER
jgi:hypothetical protein